MTRVERISEAVTEAGLREGVFLARELLAGGEPLFDDVRAAAVNNLAVQYESDMAHVRHVAKLSLQMFDSLVDAGLFAPLRWVVVDEVHQLAAGKRGADLSVSLERLTELAAANPQRAGVRYEISFSTVLSGISAPDLRGNPSPCSGYLTIVTSRTCSAISPRSSSSCRAIIFAKCSWCGRLNASF